MDFIKTSSLRALIELTFQRNWNGLIWMSRKGVITKRVKTVQTALSRNSAQTAQSGWPRNYVSRSAKVTSVRLKSRPKSKPTGRSRITTRETLSRGRPSFKRSRHAAHDQSARAGKQGLAAAQPVPRTTADASVRAGKERPTSGREPSAKSQSARPRRPTANPSDPDRSDSPTTRLSGRSSRPTVPTPRSTRSPF
ncbi:unnamed protein product [Microthlaspi erraticum]|uniref:Uncharacterized protein n=1 Tax=Microthlaspi erraticum TaxID=1685480 RepID=A0A6D2HGT9_9BRAS|nr:unnamed protein product [Microthlaspi erraticum]